MNNLQYVAKLYKIVFVANFLFCFQRGTADEKKAPFRASYSRVGNIKAVLQAPMLCLTATASQKVRKKLISMLNMVNVKIVCLSPDKENVKYIVEKAKIDLEETFDWLIKDMIRYQQSTEKTVIFCRSFKECGDIYDTFLSNLPSSNGIAMYHARTPQCIKDKVLSDLMSIHGSTRIVIATSALGMGVNIPDIKRVINFGVPENMEEYVQTIGRGGRDGSYVLAIMYYRGYHLARCDPTMRTFVKNKTTCRRAEVVNFFSEKCKKPPTLHQCCDVCSEKCDCGSCPTDIFKQSSSNIESKMANFHLSRSVSDNERQTFFELLNDLRDASNQSTSVLGTMYFHETSSLDDEIIECLTRDLEHLFSIDYIMQNFNIVSEILAEKILGVVNDIFSDLKESEFLSQLDFMRISENEQFFASVPEQNPSDSSDESVDEL